MADVSHVDNAFEVERQVINDEYIKKLRSTCKSDIPSDFNVWTAQEQHDWVRQNMTDIYHNTPKTLQYMIPAYLRVIDFKRSQKKLPEWMDIDKYRRGQKFARDNYFSIAYGLILSAIYTFSFEDGFIPMLIAGNTYTPYSAFKRYLNTAVGILSWYDGEPWVKGTKAYLNMQIARAKHERLNNKILSMNDEQIKAATKIKHQLHLEPEIFLKSFAPTCPFGNLKGRFYKICPDMKTQAMTNGTVSAAQNCFMLLHVLYPRNVGTQNATEENLEAFCHMWRCYAYFLGVEDEYNVGRDSLKEIKERMKDFSEKWLVQNFSDALPGFMHITRCLLESLNYYPFLYIPYKTLTLLFVEALNLKMPDLYASFNYKEWIAYHVINFIVRQGLKFSLVRVIANRMTRTVFKKASNFEPEKLEELQKKSKQYISDFSNKS